VSPAEFLRQCALAAIPPLVNAIGEIVHGRIQRRHEERQARYAALAAKLESGE
jgi:hypothetical protein